MAYYARWCDDQNISLTNATAPQVASYVAAELTAHARSTAMNRLLAARSFYRYLCAIGQRKTDPTAPLPIKRDKLQPRRPYNQTELESLVAQAVTLRDRALLLMLIGSGCRRAEIVAMQTEHIDWARGRILIKGKGGKERWVAPGQTALQALGEHLGGRCGRVFPMTGHQAYVLIRKLAAQASVVGAHCHRFRITFAVTFLRRYGDLAALKEILGHTELRTTEQYATFGIVENALGMQARLDLAALAQQRRYSLAG